MTEDKTGCGLFIALQEKELKMERNRFFFLHVKITHIEIINDISWLGLWKYPELSSLFGL